MPRIPGASRRRYEELVSQHHGAVYATAYRITRNTADAEDVTQQVFLEVWRKGSCGEERSLRWLASRLACNRLRDERNLKRREEAHAMQRGDSHVDSTAELREQEAHVRRQLDALPDELRVPLVLRFQEAMTLANVADVLACAESTVHEHIRRGLERLRRKLQGSGLALSLVQIENSLASAETVVVPAALQAKLLGLVSAPLLASWSLPALALPALLAVAALSAPLWWPTADETDRDAAGSVAVVPASGGAGESAQPRRPLRVAVAAGGGSTARQRQQTATDSGTIRGFVRDERGAPLADALVTAHSLAYWGKEPLYGRTTRTARDGSFELQVPARSKEGTRYRLRASLEGHVGAAKEPLVVRPHAVLAHEDLQLRARVAEAAGRWEYVFEVCDPKGDPYRGAIVVAYHMDHERPDWDVSGREAAAASDARGVAVLTGDRLGEKRIVIDGQRCGGRLRRLSLPIAHPGMHRRRIVMQRGLTISGHVRRVGGGALRGYAIDAYVGDRSFESIQVHTDERGRFEVPGCSAGPYTLAGRMCALDGEDLSPFRRQNVPAGAADVLLEVKRRDDLRDVGLHDAEIHGRVVEAATGQAIAVSGFDIEVVDLGAAGGDERARIAAIVARRVHPQPVQVAYITPQEVEEVPVFRIEPAPRADRTGEFHQVGLRPGRYLVVVRLRGRALAFTGPIVLGLGQIARDVVVRVEAGVDVRGRIVDPFGAGVAGAVVFVLGDDEESRELALQQDAAVWEAGHGRVTLLQGAVRTGTQGRFTLPNLPPRLPLVIHVVHPDLAPASLGPLPMQRFRATPAEIRLRARR